MEHLKTIETFLKMATAAQAAQDEVVALEADIEKQVVHAAFSAISLPK